MSDIAAAEGEAEAAAAGPRFTPRQGMVAGAVGSMAMSFTLTWLLVFGGFSRNGSLVVLPLGAFAYAIGLLVWAGLWKRPLHVAGVIGAALVGFLVGYVLAIAVANAVSTGPDL